MQIGVGDDAVHDPDLELPRKFLAQPTDIQRKIVQRLQQAPGGKDRKTALLCQFEPLRATAKQLDTEAIFQRPDVDGNGRGEMFNSACAAVKPPWRTTASKTRSAVRSVPAVFKMPPSVAAKPAAISP